MTEIIYADLLLLINLTADFLILLLTSLFSVAAPRLGRFLLSALIGALVGTCTVCIGENGIISVLAVCITPVIMCFVAFGKRRIRAFSGLVFYFYLSSVLLYGGMYAMFSFVSLLGRGSAPSLGFSVSLLLLGGVFIIYMLCSSLCRSGIKRRENQVKAELFDGIRSYSLNLLVDSGNVARDPFSAKPVAVISGSALDKELIRAVSAGFDETITQSEYSHIKPRVIPLKTVSGTSLLYAFIPKSLYIHTGGKKIKADCIVAIDTHDNSFFGRDGIIPQSLIGTV